MLGSSSSATAATEPLSAGSGAAVTGVDVVESAGDEPGCVVGQAVEQQAAERTADDADDQRDGARPPATASRARRPRGLGLVLVLRRPAGSGRTAGNGRVGGGRAPLHRGRLGDRRQPGLAGRRARPGRDRLGGLGGVGFLRLVGRAPVGTLVLVGHPAIFPHAPDSPATGWRFGAGRCAGGAAGPKLEGPSFGGQQAGRRRRGSGGASAGAGAQRQHADDGRADGAATHGDQPDVAAHPPVVPAGTAGRPASSGRGPSSEPLRWSGVGVSPKESPASRVLTQPSRSTWSRQAWQMCTCAQARSVSSGDSWPSSSALTRDPRCPITRRSTRSRCGPVDGPE